MKKDTIRKLKKLFEQDYIKKHQVDRLNLSHIKRATVNGRWWVERIYSQRREIQINASKIHEWMLKHPTKSFEELVNTFTSLT